MGIIHTRKRAGTLSSDVTHTSRTKSLSRTKQSRAKRMDSGSILVGLGPKVGRQQLPSPSSAVAAKLLVGLFCSLESISHTIAMLVNVWLTCRFRSCVPSFINVQRTDLQQFPHILTSTLPSQRTYQVPIYRELHLKCTSNRASPHAGRSKGSSRTRNRRRIRTNKHKQPREKQRRCVPTL